VPASGWELWGDPGTVDGFAVAGRAAACGWRVRFAGGVAVVVGAWRAAGDAAPERSGGRVVIGSWLVLSELDARVLRATDPSRVRRVERVARLACCSEELAASSLRRLRGRMLVEVDGCRPRGWLRTRDGDVVLEHTP
jgi:hypothetical protein